MKPYPPKPGLLVLSHRQQEILRTGTAVEINVLSIHRTLIGWAMPPSRSHPVGNEKEPEPNKILED